MFDLKVMLAAGSKEGDSGAQHGAVTAKNLLTTSDCDVRIRWII